MFYWINQNTLEFTGRSISTEFINRYSGGKLSSGVRNGIQNSSNSGSRNIGLPCGFFDALRVVQTRGNKSSQSRRSLKVSGKETIGFIKTLSALAHIPSFV
jgi:hypothetical protein